MKDNITTFAMMTNRATNDLSQFRSSKAVAHYDYKMPETAIFKRKNATIYMDKYLLSGSQMTVSAAKLLDYCTVLLTRQNDYQGNSPLNTVIKFSLKDYAELKGTPTTQASIDKLRKDIKSDLDLIMSITIEWEERIKDRVQKYSKMHVCQFYEIKNSVVSMEFTNKMANALDKAYMTKYPPDLLKIDERNSAAYSIGRKMAIHNAMKSNQKNGTANILSVKSLLDCCEDIPTYKKVQSGDRHYKQKIIVPFIKALNKQNIFNWTFCNEKGKPLSESQNVNKYEEFINMYVHFE